MLTFRGLFQPNIAKLESRGDIQGLVKALDYRRSSQVRQRAAEALGRIGGADAATALVSALGDTADVSQAAGSALLHVGSTSIPPLIAALTSAGWGMRIRAARVLADSGWQPDRSEAGAMYLIASGRWDELASLGELAIEPLIVTLDGGDYGARAKAAEALRNLYRNEELDPRSKARLLAVNHRVLAPHEDQSTEHSDHSDGYYSVCSEGGSEHEDETSHEDSHEDSPEVRLEL